ncbi:MAG: flagellar basal body rod protein FlgB [Clostridia bacterium]|nr:flagellar basal body rod protein FlgB [Clostridia bacterium]
MSWLDSNSLKLTKTALDDLWLSQRYSLENIANADTPNYKAKFVSFADQLHAKITMSKNQLDRSRVVSDISDDIDNSIAWVISDTSETTREDNNNVDLDSEFLEIARTQLQYQYAIRQISQEFQRLQTAITG